MARKRLSDLVREEAGEKPTPAVAPEQKPETAAKPVTKQPRSTSPKAEDEAVTTIETTAVAQPDSDGQQRVPELETALAQAQQREHDLQKQVTVLEAELHAQQSFNEQLQQDLGKLDQLKAENEQLQQDLGKLDQLKAELDDAKKMILQLSAVNEAPKNSSITPVAKAPMQPAKRTLPYHYEVQKSQPAPPITEQDLGWVD